MNTMLLSVFMVVVNVALWLIFLRFVLQLAEVDKKNPYVRPAYHLTAIVDIFARIFPAIGKGRVSTSAIALMLLLWFIQIAGQASISGDSLTALQLFFFGTMTAMMAFCNALKWIILASVVSSFIVLFTQKIHPVIEILLQLATPLIEPFRKITPDLGMIDLAPLIAMLAFGLMATAIRIVASHFAFYLI